MNWRTKAYMGRVLGGLPAGRHLHAFVQRRVLRSLPLPDIEFQDRCTIAHQHASAIRALLGTADLGHLKLLEFGSGWDLTIPQLLWMHGVRHQITMDLRRLCREEFLFDARARLSGLRDAMCEATEVELERLPQGSTTSRAYLDALNIDYRAPADATRTELATSSVDAVTSSLVLEHVPPEVIRGIYNEMFRVLRPGGAIFGSIDMSDHFSHSDPTISPWNFLTLTADVWERYNGELLYQNRLRGHAHVELLRASGFEVISVESRVAPSPVSFEDVRPRIVAPFNRMPDDVLKPTQAFIVARKPA